MELSKDSEISVMSVRARNAWIKAELSKATEKTVVGRERFEKDLRGRYDQMNGAERAMLYLRFFPVKFPEDIDIIQDFKNKYPLGGV